MSILNSESANAVEVIRRQTAVSPVRQPHVMSMAAAEVEAEASLDLGRLLRRYIWLLLILAVLGAMGGFVSVILATPMYRSRLLLEIQPSRGKMSSEAEDAVLQTQMLMMRSGGFIRRVVERMQVETMPVSAVRNDLFTRLRSRFRPELRNSAQLVTDGIQSAAATLSIRPINGTTLLEISCESIHPDLAASFANMVGSEFIDQNLQNKAVESQRTSQWLAAQVEETKSKLHEAEQKLQDFVRSSGNLFAMQELTLADSSLRQFQGELATAQADRIGKQARYELMAKAPAEQAIDLLEDPLMRAQRSKLLELKHERTVLLSRWTASHPKVKLIDSQITDVEQTLNREAKLAVERLKNDFVTAQQRERKLLGAHAGAAGQVTSQAAQAAQYAALKREVDILRQTYSQILVQTNETSITNALPQNNMRVVDTAVANPDPLRPKPSMNIAFGMFAGVGLGVGFAFLRERLDRSLKRPGSARELLNARELGVIPAINASKPMQRSLRIKMKLRLDSVFGKSGESAVATKRPAKVQELIGWQQRSLLAESFRHVLAGFLRTETHSGSNQLTLVTSPNPGEGKTMVCANLAIALAETGKRVLVIDADFRRPRIHSIFGLDNERGIGDLLGKDIADAQEIESFIKTTAYPGLSALVNGPELEDLSRILYSERLQKLLNMLRAQYDMILIDAPPVLQIADTRIIDQLVDGVILVLRSGSTDRKSALEAYRCLHEDGANILGTILNDWWPSRKKTNGYYNYVRNNAEGAPSSEGSRAS